MPEHVLLSNEYITVQMSSHYLFPICVLIPDGHRVWLIEEAYRETWEEVQAGMNCTYLMMFNVSRKACGHCASVVIIMACGGVQ